MCLFNLHFPFILPLTNFQHFSFSTGDSTGKRLNTNILSALSLVASKGSLLWVPSVLLLLSSAAVKKKGKSLRAHLCRSVSLFSTSFTTRNFLGVTHERTTSSPTSMSEACSWWQLVSGGTIGAVGVVSFAGVANVAKGVVGTSGMTSSKSSLRLAKVAESMVGRSSCSGIWKD